MFTGSFTALVTPFKGGKKNTIDEEALRALVEFQIANGTNGLVPCGTTGESATLSYEEHNRVIDVTIETAAGRVPVIAGTGSNSTSETIMLTKHAAEAGADGALLISPYYNKPTQEGLIEHYRAVAREVPFPLVVYNVPGRTGVNMLPETIGLLSRIENIEGVKEATGDLSQISDVIEMSREGFSVLSGDDLTTLPLLTMGGSGVISVVSNLAPRDVSDMCALSREGRLEEARALHYKLQPLNRAMFVETNPIPVKTALSMMGMAKEEFRLPLVKMSGTNRDKVRSALEAYGLI